MSLLNMSILKLHEKLKSLIQTERKITAEILKIIQTLDISKDYRKLGYSSLFEYLTSGLGYSEGAAQRRISAARLLKQCPQVEADIQLGKLNLTQVSLAQSAFQQQEKHTKTSLSFEKKTEILEKLCGQSSFETKRILLNECPEFEIPKPKIQPLRENRISVSLEFKDSDWQKVKKLMAQMSHKVPDQKLENLLIYWADQLAQKEAKALARDLKGQTDKVKESTQVQVNKIKSLPHIRTTDTKNQQPTAALLKPLSPPLRRQFLSKLHGQKFKPTRQDSKLRSDQDLKPRTQSKLEPEPQLQLQPTRQTQPWSAPGIQLPPELNPKRKQQIRSSRAHIPLSVQRAVRKRAQHQCQYVSKITGKRCLSRHFLEIEHIQPKALGGGDGVENLKLLCRAHNQEMAKVWGISR